MLHRTPSSPVFSLRREIDRLFEDTFAGEQGMRRGWTPAVDVRESASDFTFELELPGVAPEHVEVTADNGVLTVRGEKTQRSTKENDDGRFHFVERSYGSFVRAFQLPQNVEEDAIAADFAHGVLTIRVPKAQRPQPRKIQIGTAGRPEQQQLGSAGPSTDAQRQQPTDAGRPQERGRSATVEGSEREREGSGRRTAAGSAA